MKSFLTLILAAGMTLSAVNGASAADIKVSGAWLTSFTFTDNLYGKNALNKDSNDGAFNAAQRVRINFDVVASEALSGRVQLQVANGDARPNWYSYGNAGVGGPGYSVTARLAYLDWLIPNTDVLVRMGRQEVSMPSYTFVSSVLSSSNAIDGVMVSAPINDMVAVNLGWLRPNADVNKWGSEHVPHSSFDLVYLGVDVAGDSFKVTPWGMVGFIGSDSSLNTITPGTTNVARMGIVGFDAATENTTAYWVGIGGELTLFDPFKFTADFMYSGNDADGLAERSGWYAALGAEIKTSLATPFVRGWYASGDDADSEGSDRMLVIAGNGGFDASAIYNEGNALLSPTIDRTSAEGSWGVELGVKNVSFIEDLTHRLSLSYIQGTNNTNRISAKMVDWAPTDYLTTGDSLWEVDFLSSYKLYQNLTANLLLAYMITDFDESIRTTRYDNAFRGTLNFTYSF